MSTGTGNQVWHVHEVQGVLRALEATEQGLTQGEAAARLAKHGPNQLPQQPPPAWWRILLRQFQSPLIYILVAAAVVAIMAGDFKDAGFIALVLAINALIGGYQEWRAEQSSRALQKLLRCSAAKKGKRSTARNTSCLPETTPLAATFATRGPPSQDPSRR